MKKRILALLGLTSVALAASVISLNSSKSFSRVSKFSDNAGVPDNLDSNLEAVKCEPAYNSVDQYYNFQNTSTAKQGIALNHIGDISKVWDKTKGEGMRIAIIDSGIDADHPDFKYDDGTSKVDLDCARYYANVTGSSSSGYTVVPGNTAGSTCLYFVADGSKSYTIDGKYVTGKDVVAHNGDTSHGTNTASTAASANNPYSKTGCIGIAPQATIVPIKVDMYSNSIYYALNYIHELNTDSDPNNNIDVINISIVGYGLSTTYYNDVTNPLISDKTIIIASAGNDSKADLAFPAADKNVIGVGALARDSKTDLADYSNFNSSTQTQSTVCKNTELVAPGSVYVADYNSGSTYKENQGTSFSSPIVAGAAVLWKSLNKTSSVSTFKSALLNSCVDIGDTGWDTTFGAGRLDIGALVGVSDHVATSSVSLDSSVSVEVNGTTQLTPTVTPSNATSQDFLYWSDSTSVATVSADGLITGVSEGTTTVHCKSMQNDNAKDTITVNVGTGGGEEEDDDDIENPVTFTFGTDTDRDIQSSSGYATKSKVKVTANGDNISSDYLAVNQGRNNAITVESQDDSVKLYSATLTMTNDSQKWTANNGTMSGLTWTASTSSGVNSVSFSKGTASGVKQSKVSNISLTLVVEGGSTPTSNYTVSFNSNGGSGTMSNKTTTGSTYVVPACTFTKTNYTFQKWALNSISGTQYSVGSTITGITGNITLYAIWGSGSGSGGAQMDPHYYDQITSDLTGSDLLSALRTLNLENRTRTISYDDMGTSPSGYYRYTDYDPATVQYDGNGQPYGTKILSFYSGISTTSWNREHVWPNSRGGGSGGNSGTPYVDQDIYMPRPTISQENSNRGNSKYVEGVVSTSEGWDPVAAFESTIGTYSNIRGECARIIFYCMTVNSKLVLDDTATGGTTGVTMGKLSDLLKWNLNYPVNDREIRRQSGGQYLQGNRNAFVDDPSYACKIWGTYNSTTKQICGITDRNLSSIAISGNYKTEFEVGDTFSFGGTVTASYESGSPADVTSKATFTGYDLNITGTQTVTVSYTENNVTKSTTYQITVSDPAPRPDPTGITVSPTTASIEVGATTTLTATVSPSDANPSVTWTSSDPTVATVANGVVTGVKAGSATITAKTVNNLPATCVVTVTQPSTVKASIDFTNSNSTDTDDYGNTWTGSGGVSGSYYRLDENDTIKSSSIKMDTSKTISIKVSMGSYGGSGTLQSYAINSRGEKVTNTLSWSATDKGPNDVTGNLTFSNTGDENIQIVFARSAGQVRFYTADVTYAPFVAGPEVTDISVDPTSMNLDLYGTYSKTLTASVTADDGADTTVSWESSDTSVATVSASTGNSITVTGLKVGNATITATAGEKTATCSVSVTDSTPVVHTVTISSKPTSLDVYNKKTGTITVSIDADAGADTTVLWTSSDTSVATIEAVTSGGGASVASIDASATITAVGVGTTTITASAGGKEASYNLTIADSTPHATDVSLDITSRTLVINEKVQLTETIIPSDAVEQGVTWSSNNTSVATVSTSGLVTAIAVGEATITVTTVDGGHTATCTITVISSSAAAVNDAKEWAIEFIQKTTTTSTCKASTDAQRLSGLKGVWSELEASYEELSNEAKTAFCTNSDTKIKEALNHYQFIISKFNKNSNELNDFVVDGNGNKPASSSRSLLSTMFSKENSGLAVVILSVVGLVAIGSFFVFRKRKTY